jgi:hypothetical protein
MKSVEVCLVVREMSGGTAECAESVISIRRIRSDEAHRHERSDRTAPLLSRLDNLSSMQANHPSCKREPHRQGVN